MIFSSVRLITLSSLEKKDARQRKGEKKMAGIIIKSTHKKNKQINFESSYSQQNKLKIQDNL